MIIIIMFIMMIILIITFYYFFHLIFSLLFFFFYFFSFFSEQHSWLWLTSVIFSFSLYFSLSSIPINPKIRWTIIQLLLNISHRHQFSMLQIMSKLRGRKNGSKVNPDIASTIPGISMNPIIEIAQDTLF